MKQNKKNKLALTKQTVRSMTAVVEGQLEGVAGGSLVHTRANSQCGTNYTAGPTCQQ